jgi:Winged helix-turn helix
VLSLAFQAIWEAAVALKVVSMEELKLVVLLEPERTGASVAEVCRRQGIFRASFYRYRRRYFDEGVEGLEPRSRRPRSSPGQIVSTSSAAVSASAGRTADGEPGEVAFSSKGSDSAITGRRCRAFRFFVWSPLVTTSEPSSSARAA